MTCQSNQSVRRAWPGRGLSILIATAGLLVPAVAAAQYETSSPRVLSAFRTVVAGPSQSTVRVKCDGKDATLATVVSADGWLLTKASELKKGAKLVCRLRDGRELEARRADSNERYDLALLKIEVQGLTPVKWKDSKVAPVGNWVAVPGTGEEPVAIGVVSVAARKIKADGPLWVIDPSAIGYLGIILSDAPDTGVKIGRVMPGTGADKAGLKANDTILMIAGKAIKDGDALFAALGRFKPGDVVNVRVKRGDQEVEVKATLGKRPVMTRGDFQNRMGSELSTRRQGFPAFLQHDTVLKPSDCGGPLVDLDGNAIGINIARAGRTESYAIPAEAVLPLLRELSNGKLTPPVK
jgi:serine protease Do